MRKALADSGYADISTEVISHAPAPPAEEASAPVITEEAPVSAVVQESEPAADPVDPSPAEVTPASDPQANPQEPRRAPRNSRERKIIRLEEQLRLAHEEREKRDRELENLRAKLTAPPAPPVDIPAVTKTEDPKPAAPAPAPVAAGPDPDETPLPKPKRADYFDADDPDEAYTDAMFAWKDQERERASRLGEKVKARQEQESKSQEEARKRQEAEDERKSAEQKASDEYQASIQSARTRHADWDAVLATPGDLCSPAMGHVVKATANAEILYWLGKHPEAASRICRETQLPEKPTQQDVARVMRVVYREFDKIDADIQASLAVNESAQDSAADEDEDEDEDELAVTPQVAPAAAATPKTTPAPATPTPQVQPPASPAPAAHPPVVKPKFTPVTPVGSRGGVQQKTLAEMTPDEMRSLSPEEFRKLRGM